MTDKFRIDALSPNARRTKLFLRFAVFGFALAALAPAAPAASVWQELPDTKLKSVCPADNFGGMSYAFSYLCHNVIAAWGGAAADTKRNRLIIWGGGHSDYYGNEIYSLNLGATPATLTRLNDPSPINSTPAVCVEALADGKPNGRHTYGNLVYMPHVDRMFAHGGSLSCGNGWGGTDTWTLDMETLQWQRMDPTNGFKMPDNLVINAAYDPNTKSVLVAISGKWHLFRYTYETNTYTLLSDTTHVGFESTGVIDPKRNLYVFFGREYGGETGKVWAIDISAGSKYQGQEWTSQVTGCEGLANSSSPGLVYDPVLDRIVGWPNAGGTLYLFNPDTKSCTVQTLPNGPQSVYKGMSKGTYGRFAYFPGLGRYGLVSDADRNAFALTLSGFGTAPAPDTTAPAVSVTSPANGATVSAVVSLNAAASDNVGVASVQFTVDGANFGTPFTSAPYTISWNTATVTNGTHVLRAVARDAAGNIGTSTAVTVTVNNVSAPPPPPPPSTPLPSSGTAISGLGGSTLTCVDRDGDGYGTGEGCVGPDADDLDATVRSGPEAIAKHGSLKAVLAHLGYKPVNIYYVSPTGNDASAQKNDINRPFQTFRALPVVPGDAVIFRHGTYSTGASPPRDLTGPVIYMSYPGELATLSGPTAGIDMVDRSNLIIDGIKFENGSCMAGGTWDAIGTSPITKFHDITIRHVEALRCQSGFSAFNGLINITIEDSSFHHNTGSHGLYLGSRFIPGDNVIVRRNLMYGNNWNGFQFNGRVTNMVVSQNIVYNNGLSGLSFLQGVKNSFVRSNLIFNNSRAGIIFYNYDGDCYDSSTTKLICPDDQTGNVIENNTIYVGSKGGDGSNSEGQPAIHVVNTATGKAPDGTQVAPAKVGDLGHNTFRNNILVSWGGGNHYPPVHYIDTDKDYLATSTFINNVFYQNDGKNGTGVIGFGPGEGFGYKPHSCAAAAAITNMSGCVSAEPQFVAASPTMWNSAASFDLHLKSSSPAVQAGKASGAVYDLAGTAFASPPSIGAYEAVAGTAPPPPTGQACDMNGDGTVNALDVAHAIKQALGDLPCTTAALEGDGRCTVVGVQRVVNTSRGGACLTGK